MFAYKKSIGAVLKGFCAIKPYTTDQPTKNQKISCSANTMFRVAMQKIANINAMQIQMFQNPTKKS